MIRRRIDKSRAERTTKTYRAAARSYEQACTRLKIIAWPATEVKLIAYVSYAHEVLDLRPSSINTYISAIAHHNRLHGWDNPRKGLLGLILDGCRQIDRDNGIEPKIRQGISGTLLKEIISRLDLTEFRQARFAAYAVLSYFGGFRASELIESDGVTRFHWDDISFYPNQAAPQYLIIKQHISKTRRFGPTMEIPICRTDGPTCPVKLFQHYASFFKTRPNGERPVFVESATTPKTRAYAFSSALSDTRHFSRGLGVPAAVWSSEHTPSGSEWPRRRDG